MIISQAVRELRIQMKREGIDAYIIPSSDPHQSEYVADHWKSRAWISGFTGSAGTAALTATEAGVWTDSRYFIQAEEQLKNSPFALHKVYNQGSPQYIDWIISKLNPGASVACDGRLFSKKMLARIKSQLEAKDIELKASIDLISAIWKLRPTLPKEPIFSMDLSYVGESRASKLKRIRTKMKDYGAQHHLISTLDDIAWIFNIRGRDVTYNPVAYAYALIKENSATLFIDPAKVDSGLQDLFTSDEIELQPYKEIWKTLNNLAENDSILIDGDTTSHALHAAINCTNIVDKPLPSIHMKAIKNEVEIQHFRDVMEKDGVALTQFYIWLEANLDQRLTEYDLVQKIAEFRAKQEGYQSESFGAIVGYKGNGAIVHYAPPLKGSAILAAEGVLLIDSGGQYLNGTTDITRTISLGHPTAEEKDAYTRVLKGNIALDRALFPEGTLGVQLDTLARIALWENKLNFLHGTGHGVGFFLNVHEGPQGFHPGIASRSKIAIDEHMVTTNEPGYYEDGKFGIRIENCLLAKKAGTSSSGSFLQFETLTLFPIDTQLIERSLLCRDEVHWINNYHEVVIRRLSPHLSVEEQKWIEAKCKAI